MILGVSISILGSSSAGSSVPGSSRLKCEEMTFLCEDIHTLCEDI